uniref:Uncharacterized protein n=1 Tax=Romanomermis culicivorax TaxID=13658 RepID=A0A915HN38_ROMCU
MNKIIVSPNNALVATLRILGWDESTSDPRKLQSSEPDATQQTMHCEIGLCQSKRTLGVPKYTLGQSTDSGIGPGIHANAALL